MIAAITAMTILLKKNRLIGKCTSQDYFIFYNGPVIPSPRVKYAIKTVIFCQCRFLTDWIVMRDIRGIDNSWVLTRVSSRTVICAHELLSGPALSNEQNRITTHYGHTHVHLIVATRNFTRTDITVAILSFTLESNQFLSFYYSLFLSIFFSQTNNPFHQTYFIVLPNRLRLHQPFIIPCINA